MSRIHLALGLALVASACAAPLAAQEQGSDRVTEAIEAAREAYGPPPPGPPPPDCAEPEGDEIVVCAELEEQSQFRVRSDEDAENEYAAATMNKDNPTPPNVDGPGIFQGPATVGNLCIPGLQKCPPPPAYFIDFEALPDAPPGSDADRISRGLPPRGDDGDFVPEQPEADADAPDDGVAEGAAESAPDPASETPL